MVARLQSGSGGRARQRGFSYLFLLIAVAAIGIVAANAVSLGASASRRDAELELLAIGAEFENALRSFRTMRGTRAGAGPRALDDLLLDERMPGLRRHLRKIYVDPLTGRREWGVVKHPDGSIAGVHSLAPGMPIKRTGFEAHRSAFHNAERYEQWVFVAAP